MLAKGVTVTQLQVAAGRFSCAAARRRRRLARVLGCEAVALKLAPLMRGFYNRISVLLQAVRGVAGAAGKTVKA